jgi:sulfotransferase family protein
VTTSPDSRQHASTPRHGSPGTRLARTKGPLPARARGGAARSTARRAWHVAGRMTAPARLLPGFLIVGAQRCGTTSLAKALFSHPQVRQPFDRKGIHYFDTGYGHGMAWYRAHFPLAWPGSRAITGESSPYYMFHPLAGERIAADLPRVRLIAALRDPVERAYSAHAHELARGFETEPFERALELEEARLAGVEEALRGGEITVSHSHQHQAYLARGRYIDQLERLESLVGRDRIHVVDSGAFFANPGGEFSGLLAFLGLPPAPGIDYGQYNARPRAPMPDSLRHRLEEHFAPYDERLARWLGRTPSWRN